MSDYPVHLNLNGKRVIIVGGGHVAVRKVKGLLGSGALIRVVSPQFHLEIMELAKRHNITLVEREIKVTDLADAFLIITATSSGEINDFVVKHAGENQLINASHQAEQGNVSIPATLRQGRLVISVSTGGASPLLAKKIRDDLSVIYNDSYNQYVERLYKKRLGLKRENLSEDKKKEILENEISKGFLESTEFD